VQSEGGGQWNEWTVAFDDGRHAFLAEALGSFTLFFERAMAPAFDTLAVGRAVGTGFVVVERGEAKRVARWGDVPDSPRTYRYADLSSASGDTATIDYGASATGRANVADVFVGRRVRLKDLGLKPRGTPARFLAAPGGPPPKGLALWLDVGDEAELDASLPGDKPARARFRVIGVVHRSIRVEGERYTWEEYVLHSAAEGLRWLVVSDGHWNLVVAVEAGRVEESPQGARFLGELHRPWSSGKARVEWASGQLPWVTRVGDVVGARDYVRAPHMLSCESTDDELTWSYGTYTPSDAVARAFGKRLLPKPLGRAPNQPKTPKRR
jgi:hypothetical protein